MVTEIVTAKAAATLSIAPPIAALARVSEVDMRILASPASVIATTRSDGFT